MSNEQIMPLLTGDADAFEKYRQMVSAALDAMVGPAPEFVKENNSFSIDIKQQQEDYLFMAGTLGDVEKKTQLPVVFLFPKENWNGHTVIWLTSHGKAGLFDEGGRLKAEVAKLVSAGVSVAGVDLIYQGEFQADGQPLKQTPKVENKREAAAYTLGYNHSVAAMRVNDILALAAAMKNHDREPKSIGLVALDGEMAGIGSVAIARQPDAFDFALLQTGSFRFGEVDSIRSPNLLPGGAKYGDVPGFLAMGAPMLLRVIGEPQSGTKIIRQAYERAGKPDQLSDGNLELSPIDWLLNHLGGI